MGARCHPGRIITGFWLQNRIPNCPGGGGAETAQGGKPAIKSKWRQCFRELRKKLPKLRDNYNLRKSVLGSRIDLWHRGCTSGDGWKIGVHNIARRQG
jgi:hypothetical protein